MDSIGGFSTILIVAGIVELFKKLNVQGNILILVSIGIGALFGAAFRLYDMYPVIQPWLELVYYSLGFGIGAAGLYDIAKRFSGVDQG